MTPARIAAAAVALVFALTACTPSTPTTPSGTPVVASTATPTPNADQVEEAKQVYAAALAAYNRQLAAGGLGPTETPSKAITDTLADPALSETVDDLRAWKAEGNSVESGQLTILWQKENPEVSYLDSTVTLMVCQDGSKLVSNDGGVGYTAIIRAFLAPRDGTLKVIDAQALDDVTEWEGTKCGA